MRNRLVAKEEIEERLESEKEDLALQLRDLERQLALIQSQEPGEDEVSREEMEKMAEREERLVRELQEQTSLCESLRLRYEGGLGDRRKNLNVQGLLQSVTGHFSDNLGIC